MYKKILLIFSIACLLSSCVVNEEEFRRTQNRVYSLNNYTINLNQRLTKLEKKVNMLSDKIDKMETTIKAQQTLKFNELMAEIKSIKNELYDQKNLESSKSLPNESGQINEVTKEAIKDIYSKIFNLEKEIASIKNSSTTKNEQISQVKHDETYYYKKAYSLFTAGKYSDAEKAFKDFIERYKKSKLIPNAYYWLGECFFKRKMYEKAIINYDEVIVKYPKSSKVPAALLKEGISFYRIGEKDGAKLIFRKILKDYPKSTQAKYAKKYLKKLK